MGFGETLARARKKAGLTQGAVSDMLKNQPDLNTTRSTISRYETEQQRPSIKVLKALCQLYHITLNDFVDMEFSDEFINIEGIALDKISDSVVSEKEKWILTKFRSLDDYGKDTVEAVLNCEYNRCIQPTEIRHIRTLPLFTNPAAAGTGNWNEASYPEFIEVEGDVPDGTKCIIPISGNSMEPDFSDGDRVYMQPVEDCISDGEIGIFLVNGDSFIKQMGNGVLISLNKEYPDIPLADTEWKCQGRILGKVKNK